jgi:hypothetical protein
MIVYGAKRSPIRNGMILKRWLKFRTSDRRKRLDLEMKRLRKKWWHFKTRWEIVDK